MKICFFGIYNREYSRNDILLTGLKENDVTVFEYNEPANQKWRYFRLIKRLAGHKDKFDFIFCAYPSPVPTILASILSRRPIIVDAFYSMYDAVVNDRKQCGRFSPKALRLLVLDWLSVLVADIIMVDTIEHKKYWADWLFVKESKIVVVPNGVNVHKMFPEDILDSKIKKVDVTFHGNYIPLQGVEKIVEAFNILKEEKISFRLIGNGQDFKKITKLIDNYGLTDTIDIVGRVDYDVLRNYLNSTKIVMGIFGDSDKAKRVVPNKVYEGCAVRKVVITMDTEAVRSLYDVDQVVFVEPNPESIAISIKSLLNSPTELEKIAAKGYIRTISDYSPKAIVADLIKKIENAK